MTPTNLAGIFLFLIVTTLLAYPLGEYMALVFTDQKTFLTPVLSPIEKLFYKICGIDEKKEMSWKTYALCLLLFSLVGIIGLFLIQILQGHLPFNPEKFKGVKWDLSFNTAVSFVTNTNWQNYAGETTMSYLTQMLGLTVQNFVSAAAGIAVLIAMIRGFIRKTSETIGNFWVDLTRSVLYILLPLSLILAFILASQGVVQTLAPYVKAHTLQGKTQTIAVGPAASQIAIKQLGTNGGGFFNANSAHPFENPTPFTTFLELLAEFIIPVALVFTYGAMVKERKQGWAMYWAMMILCAAGILTALYFETQGNPILKKIGVEHGTNLEGKEVRIGVMPSVLWSVITTDTSTGAVDSMHDSMTPIPGLIQIFNMAIGEAIFGGVGSGLMMMIFYALITMFIAGLMIGRTPEFLGKKLGPYEMVMASIGLLSSPITLLIFSAIAISLPAGLSALTNHGPHGLSEILYAYASTANNNGSAFAGLNSNTLFYNLTLGFAMLLGRFTTLIPGLAVAGSLAKKRLTPGTAATLRSDTLLFVVMLIGVVIVVGALTFLPPLTLGPFLEQLMMHAGRTF